MLLWFIPSLTIAQTDWEGSAAIGDYLQQQERSGFSGTVLIARKDQLLFEEAYGFADRTGNIKNKQETRFSIASLGKVFTMTAILKLVDESKLKLDDKLSRYVDGFTDQRTGQITIRHLLSHRAGWQHYWQHPEYLANRHETDSISDYMRFIKEMPLDFAPGARRQYSNIGYVVLGAVIEAVTGEDYYDHIQRTLFTPLKMKGSDYAEYSSITAAYAKHGTTGELERYHRMTAARGTADGGGYSTTGDLFRFSQALFYNNLLSEKSLNLLVNNFQSAEENKGWNIGLAGGFPGISTVLLHESSNDFTVIVLSNGNRPSATNTARELMEMAKK